MPRARRVPLRRLDRWRCGRASRGRACCGRAGRFWRRRHRRLRLRLRLRRRLRLLLRLLILLLSLVLLVLLPARGEVANADPGQLRGRAPLARAIRRRELELAHLRLEALHPHLDLVELRNAVHLDSGDQHARRATPCGSCDVFAPAPAPLQPRHRRLLANEPHRALPDYLRRRERV